MSEISWIDWSARILSLLALIVSVGSIISNHKKRNISSYKIMAVGALAFSLTLISITWGYRHVAPLLQFLLTAGTGIGFILASVSVRNNLILATYAVIAAFILAFAHVLIAFSVFSF